tara:strand:- start:680 stop:1162 length:483 start_codon:yes stop_codon:yes gene_type:complete
MIMPDGEIFEGVYDGYGRLGGEEIPLVFGPVHQPKWDDYMFQGSGYHTACYLTMEPPPTYDGPSEPAEDQGHFYDKDVDHIEPEPKVCRTGAKGMKITLQHQDVLDIIESRVRGMMLGVEEVQVAILPLGYDPTWGHTIQVEVEVTPEDLDDNDHERGRD